MLEMLPQSLFEKCKSLEKYFGQGLVNTEDGKGFQKTISMDVIVASIVILKQNACIQKFTAF